MQSTRRPFVNIPTLHYFSATRVPRIETLTHILKRRKETLGWIACYTASHTHKCLPITNPKPTFVRPATPSRSQTAANSRKPASESCKSRMDNHNCANGSEVLLLPPRRRIHFHRFVLTSHLYRSMNAYNFCRGCSRAHYHAVCLNRIWECLRVSHNRHIMSLSQLIPLRFLRPLGKACRGRQKRRTFY